MDRKKQIAAFVTNTFLFGDGSQLADETSFLGSGIIDSTGILELVMFIEDTYSLKVSQEEMLPENLDSIDNIDRFVSAKLTRVSQPVS